MADAARRRSKPTDVAADLDESGRQPVPRGLVVRPGATGHSGDRQIATERVAGMSAGTTMNRTLQLVLCAIAIAATPYAMARPSADDVTITVVDEGATPDDVVRVIELPDRAAAKAAATNVGNSAG